MKKILSLGIASAVLALTAVSASAAVVVKTDSAIKEGETITVDFVTDQEMGSIQFEVAAQGLEYVSHVGKTEYLANLNPTNGKFLAAGMGTKIPNGTTVLTVTYKVTAKAGETVSVNVANLAGDNDAKVSASIDKAPVVAATTSSDPGTTSSDPGTTSSDPGTTSSDPGTTSSTPGTASGTTDPGTNPPTGVALAVFPAVIAGAAVVVAKKKRG